MRKVRTALDTSIRTKNVRSFSGRSGWSGKSSRGHAGGYTSGSYGFGMHRKKDAAAISYRKEALEQLTFSQRRALEKLPVQTQEELFLKTEKRIDRRISAGRYREYGTTAAVAEGSAGIDKGRMRSQNSHVRTFSEQMDTYGYESYRSGYMQPGFHGWQEAHRLRGNARQGQENGSTGFAEDEASGRNNGKYLSYDDTGSGFGEDPFSGSYLRKKYARQLAQKAKERRLKARRELSLGSKTGNPILEQKDKPGQGGGYEGGSRDNDRSDRGGDTYRGNGSARERQNSRTGNKAGRNISHDYAKILGRLVETQVRFTKQLENSRADTQRQRTIQELKEKEAGRVYRIVSFSLSKVKAAAQDLIKAAKFLASKGKGYLILLLIPVMLLVMMVPLLLSSLTITQEEPSANATALELVEYALSWVGVTRYIWGDGRAYETDWQDYTDCSGFVHGVFSHFGHEIGGDTVSMEGSGTLIDTNNTDKALPGDIILFFSGGIASGNSTHVGIYIGDGQMVHCSGGRANVSPETAGPGVMVTMVAYDSRSYQVRRIIPENVSGGVGTGGHRVDPTNYSMSDLQLIWAIVAQEDNGSYEGALAVISSAMNRADSAVWGYLGSTAIQQLTAPGQYCYSNDHYWVARLGGNVPDYVKQAVNDCLKKGIRNHSFTCFRSMKGSQTGPDAVQIGGNWFFGN